MKSIKERSLRKVLFVFDRVAHYHRDLFWTLEKELNTAGLELNLLSGEDKSTAVGRVGLQEQVIHREFKYRFHEYRFGSYTFRSHSGVVGAISRIQPDIVVVLGHVGNISHWVLMGLKRRLGFKLVAWQCAYEYNPGRFKDTILKRFIPGFDHHLAYHTNAAGYALNYGASEDEVTIIHNTINEASIAIMPKEQARAGVVERHPSIGSRKIVLFVGAVLAEKRIEIILQAMEQLDCSDAVLVIVGDGPHMPQIRKQCEGRDDVILTGVIVEGVGPYFDSAEVYVLPGTGGLGINEAMAHRLPIISGYADGSADDLVVDGENGFRLRNGSPEELKEKISIILDNSDLAARMGARSRELITGKFAFREFVSRVTKTLKNL